jgi:hypothetical protein
MKEVFYKAKEDFVHRKVAESDVLISVGANVANFNGYITLNPTASLLWDALATPQTIDTLTQMLTTEFDVSDEVAKTDVENFLEMLKRNSMVTVYEDT